ncbi:MAG: hypothetical protein UU36_C0039G0003 [Candidatus Uhrbacteria bacterium GW2011_GWE2_41_1153]|nr:MAG: hypothetical protein UU36_C0039G0003 [Candidatus Uhrbacteria bacterium GW2011_GWE2_41_1153]
MITVDGHWHDLWVIGKCRFGKQDVVSWHDGHGTARHWPGVPMEEREGDQAEAAADRFGPQYVHKRARHWLNRRLVPVAGVEERLGDIALAIERDLSGEDPTDELPRDGEHTFDVPTPGEPFTGRACQQDYA